MSIINGIRKQSGLLIFIITIALISFIVGADFITSMQTAGQNQSIGIIDGQEISRERFGNEVENVRANFRQQYGTSPSSEQMGYIRTQAWENVFQQVAITEEYTKLGIEVSPDEVADMVKGNNVHPQVKALFSNPETGLFDKNILIGFLQKINQYPREYQLQYYQLESALPQMRLQEKYNNLFQQTMYATSEEAKQLYEAKNSKIDLKYVYVPFASVADSSLTVSDDDVEAYYNNNQEDYSKDATISLEYVTFDIIASAEDSAEVLRDLTELKAAFENTESDTLFIQENSEARKVFFNYSASGVAIPASLEGEELTEGKVIGPILSGSNYNLYKVTSTQEDTAYSMRARHILFRTEKLTDEEKAEKKQKALDVLKEIKDGGDFGILAGQYGEDNTSRNGGDLGWFKEGRMVDAFEKAVLAATSEGVLANLVETDFGFHIIDVTGVKTKAQTIVGVVSKQITASEATRDDVYRRAGDFATSKNYTDFVDKVKASGNMMSVQALDLKKGATSINNIVGVNNVRPIIRWAFDNKTELGGISETFELDNKYLIALLRGRQEEGVYPFKKVKQEVTVDYKKTLKSKKILTDLAAGKTVEEKASKYGAKAQLISDVGVSYVSNTLKGAGSAPLAVGKAFSMKEGETSAPFADANGVFVLQVIKINKAADVADYTQYKNEILQGRTIDLDRQIVNSLKELTNTTENISTFY